MNDLYIEDSGDRALGELRAISAYSGLRFLINLLFWFSLVGGLGGIGYYVIMLWPIIQMKPVLLVVWLVLAVAQVIVVNVLRGLALVLVDIADAQLQHVERSLRTSAKSAGTSFQ